MGARHEGAGQECGLACRGAGGTAQEDEGPSDRERGGGEGARGERGDEVGSEGVGWRDGGLEGVEGGWHGEGRRRRE